MTTRTTTQGFFDPHTWTVSYVVWDHATERAAVIDPVLDFDFKSGHTSTVSADRLLAYVRDKGLQVDWILETHAHAEHLSGARYVQAQVGGRIAIGENIRTVQATFKKLYNLERSFLPDGSQFDHLFKDGEVFRIGEVEATAMLVPGHTPADMAYLVGDSVFVGDTLFMPDVGSARADIPGGDAHQLYASMRRLLDLPPETTMYVCDDYPPASRHVRWQTTVAEQRAHNIHVRDGISEDAFVAMRTARDATLEVPTLILPSIQVNVRAGQLPPPDDNGVAYLRIPLNALPVYRHLDAKDPSSAT
ncbi:MULTISPECIES: MBL fold metallo-hydrolase [unclassified Variovorax]|uniref:MBL fold metallo-hydrolase n=1 Tax=unclassified Variovorax TaxID=663243 RepID=UPI00076D6765|nr:MULTISPECIES: MBL fold metallo-hydrolase [unclassified Variovorax]KWT70382.1 metallo-beta-lactamase superfamily [Variovorax sp. WDL1]PNG49812.1 putative metallo-hydrolase [Variovorax sp. B2]PNG50684.1 putative metallo-hydrolase [Variovorax sp. B4]VTV17875.1 putative metallo-hydrolase [Variovorax sp. WDL1]